MQKLMLSITHVLTDKYNYNKIKEEDEEDKEEQEEENRKLVKEENGKRGK